MLAFLKKHFVRVRFKHNAVVGENPIITCSANCINTSQIRENINIGSNSFIMGTLYAYRDGKISIGHHFYMGNSSFIGAADSISIGSCVIISNNVTIYDNNNHPTEPKARIRMSTCGYSNENWKWDKAAHSPVIIEDNVWIGQYTAILKGVTIGKGSVVGAHAVVTKDIPPYSVAAGNPARVVKRLDPDADIIAANME